MNQSSPSRQTTANVPLQRVITAARSSPASSSSLAQSDPLFFFHFVHLRPKNAGASSFSFFTNLRDTVVRKEARSVSKVGWRREGRKTRMERVGIRDGVTTGKEILRFREGKWSTVRMVEEGWTTPLRWG